MKKSRRKFLKQAGVVGFGATMAGTLGACSNNDSRTKSPLVSESNPVSDPTVSKVTGPHGRVYP